MKRTRHPSGSHLRLRARPHRPPARGVEPLEPRTFLSAGDLDPTFGSGGKVLTALPGSTYVDQVHAVLQPGNKAVVLSPAGLTRYNPNGSIDTSFGTAGSVAISEFTPGLVALRPDNSIIVLGYPPSTTGDSQFVLAHYSADGAPDLAFGGGASNRVVNPTFGGVTTSGETITRILVQPDNKIVVAGSAYENQFDPADVAVARYNANGTPDTAFGRFYASTSLFDFGGDDHVEDLALMPDGGILAVGYLDSSSSHHPVHAGDFIFLRLDPTGAPDPAFGDGNGMTHDNFGSYPTENPFAETPNNAWDRATAVAVLPDGRFVVAGKSFNPADHNYYRVAVARYLPDGSVDPTFSPTGADPTPANPTVTGGPGHLLLTDPDAYELATVYLARQTDGKLILAGVNQGDFSLLTRLTPDGDWDPTFGHATSANDIAVTTDFGATDSIAALQVTPDNRLLAVGVSRPPYTSEISSLALARYVLGRSPFGGTPLQLPATLQFENFDDGGEGVAYHDTDTANLGGAYRQTGVDLQTLPAAGTTLAFTKAGEWTEYTLNVPQAGQYDAAIRYASLRGGGRFHLEIDGTPVTPVTTLPSTGDWQKYAALKSVRLTLTAGAHVLRLAMDGNDSTGYVANFDSAQVTRATPAQTPFGGTPVVIAQAGGSVELENFDDGGEGVSFHDTDTANLGGDYRNTPVDIQAISTTGHALAFTHAGEWTEYTLDVPTAGTYAPSLVYASLKGGGRVHLELDGQAVTSSVPLPSTGGWQTYRAQPLPWVDLPAGRHVLRLAMDANDPTGFVANFDRLAFTRVRSTPYLTAPFVDDQTIQAEYYDNGGEGVAYHDAEPANLGGVTIRPGDGVDLEPTGDVGDNSGDLNVGFTRPGEYLVYSVDVRSTLTLFGLSARVASLRAGGKFHFEIDGLRVVDFTVPDTGGWQKYVTLHVSQPNLTLPAGRHALKLVMDQANPTGYVANFNWLRLVS